MIDRVSFFSSPENRIGIVGFFIALLVAMPAASAVYKYIDENGQVAYGDKPVDGAKKLKIRTHRAPGYAPKLPQPTRPDNPGEEDKEVKYESFELLTPKNDKVIENRGGSVQVIFLPTPALAADHEVVVTVDGKDISRGRHANISLSQVPRGTHKVTGRIENADGDTLIKSGTVSFHVKRPVIGKNSPFAFSGS